MKIYHIYIIIMYNIMIYRSIIGPLNFSKPFNQLHQLHLIFAYFFLCNSVPTIIILTTQWTSSGRLFDSPSRRGRRRRRV